MKWPRLRILPITIGVAAFLLVSKLLTIAEGGQTVWYEVSRTATAQEEVSVDDAVTQAIAAEEAEMDNMDGDLPDDAETAEIVEPVAPPKGDPEFNQIEVDLLQSLSARREKLEAWEEEVALRAALLEATEKRINERMSELEKLRTDVASLLEQYNQEENSKIKSLVKIYESMKAKDAAAIFEELDMPVLLQVIDQMSERKAAPVLAALNPKRAKEVTIELAELRRLQQETEQAAKAAVSGTAE